MASVVVAADSTRVKHGGSLGPADFADIDPTCTGVGWADGSLVVTFDADLTPAQALRVKIRCASLDADAETLLTSAAQAYYANLDYLALATPTTVQALAQVRTLTAQVNGLLRFVTRL